MKEKRIHSEKFDDGELKKLAPTLFGISTENHFTVPDGYFDSLNAEVVRQIQIVYNFEAVARGNPFAVPEGYFNSLTVAVQQRISDEKNRRIAWKEKLSSVGNRLVGQVKLTPALAFASVALLLVFGIKYLTRTISVEDTSSSGVTISELSSSGYLSDIDEGMIIDQLDNKVAVVVPAIDKSTEEYLINNDIDVNSIADQL